MWIGSRLRSGNTDIVIKTMITFRERLPPADCLRIVTLLLITDNTEISNSAGTSWEKCNGCRGFIGVMCFGLSGEEEIDTSIVSINLGYKTTYHANILWSDRKKETDRRKCIEVQEH